MANDDFSRSNQNPPAKVGRILIRLHDLPNGTQTGQFTIDLLDENDLRVDRVNGDIFNHVPQAQADAIKAFLTTIRTKATNQLIPAPEA